MLDFLEILRTMISRSEEHYQRIRGILRIYFSLLRGLPRNSYIAAKRPSKYYGPL